MREFRIKKYTTNSLNIIEVEYNGQVEKIPEDFCTDEIEEIFKN